MFARHEPDADLGLLFTDGEYNVVIFENIGPPAVETFEGLRLGLDTGGASAEIRNEPLVCGATDPELLDEGLPLLVVARRDDGPPFAAVQRWEQVEQLIDQDLGRRSRGDLPAPVLAHDVDDARRRTHLGWAVRTMLVLAAVAVGAVLGLLAVDSDGPVAYRVTDSTTAANPFPTSARLLITSGGQEQSLALSPQRATNPTTLSQVRWTLDEPLRITYWPGRAEDDRRTVTIDLRDAGATALNRGWNVVIELDISDYRTTLIVTQPAQRLFTLERTTAYRDTLFRRAPERTPTAPVASSRQPATPSFSGRTAGYNQCVRDEVKRYSPLASELDLVRRFKDLESEYLEDGSISSAESEAIATRMEQQASDQEALLRYSGLLTSRPSDSTLPELIETMRALQAQMSAAWRSSSTERINALYTDFLNSSAFLDDFPEYLDADARISCTPVNTAPRLDDR
jgi:hypothetical protein